MKIEVIVETDADGDGHFQGISTGKVTVDDISGPKMPEKLMKGATAQLTDTPEVPCRVVVKKYDNAGNPTGTDESTTVTADLSAVQNAHHYARIYLESVSIDNM